MLKNEKAMIFMASLAIVLILSGMGLAYLVTTRSEMEIAQNELKTLQSFYCAESGVAHSLADFRRGEEGNGGAVFGDIFYAAGMDYSASVDTVNKKIRVDSACPDYISFRKMEVEYEIPYPAGILAAGDITASISNAGTIKGDVVSNGAVSLHPNIIVNGTVSGNDSGLTIVPFDMAHYQDIAEHTSCAGLNTAAPAAGIYYITGDCSISGISDFHLQGTMVITGTLTISSMPGSFTIDPVEGDPALIVGGNFTSTSVWSPVLKGLVYVGNNASFSSWAGDGSIDGPLVVGGTLYMEWINNLIIEQKPFIKIKFWEKFEG